MLRDRTLATTGTKGTGDITPGAAVPGFRSWAGAAAGSYSYYIEDGSAWETGRATWDGTKLVRTLLASSTGALLDLTGSGTIGIDFLAADHVGDWPAAGATIYAQAIPFAGFTTFKVNQPFAQGGPSFGFDGIYTVPQAGLYEWQVTGRFADSVPANTQWAVGFDVVGQTRNVLWGNAGGVTRSGLIAVGLAQYAAGDQVRAYSYHEYYKDNGAPQTYGVGSVSIQRIR